ncbi:MAG: hypothetical protein JXA58_05310 [Dehalococcoidia bacterium]|nr:hypothetical protein [Dehalococcoidia bacterium]
MTIAEICPCVNVGCLNHGQCDKCISRHARLGTLNYCSLYTILPVLQQAIAADPESPAAEVLRGITERRLEVNSGLAQKNGLSEETLADLRKKVAEYSDY